MKYIDLLFCERENYELKKELRIARIGFYFMFVIVLLISILFLVYLETLGNLSFIKKNNFTYDKEIEIIYQNLTDDEIREINNLMKDLKKEYLSLARFIVFTKNKNIMNHGRNDSEIVLGKNFDKGDVYILYEREVYKDIWWMDFESAIKLVLCHELLHTLVNNKNYDEEYFIDDISEYGVCFK